MSDERVTLTKEQIEEAQEDIRRRIDFAASNWDAYPAEIEATEKIRHTFAALCDQALRAGELEITVKAKDALIKDYAEWLSATGKDVLLNRAEAAESALAQARKEIERLITLKTAFFNEPVAALDEEQIREIATTHWHPDDVDGTTIENIEQAIREALAAAGGGKK